MNRMLEIRSPRGNMMAFMLGTMMVMAVLVLFGLWYTQHTLNGTSHRSAIDSSALAAAASLSRIVVNTPEYGYVSLVGSGPTSKPTVTGDNYYQRVYGINEIMGTARVDACIAEAMNDPCLKKLAAKDAIAAQSVANQLFTALQAACASGGSGKDIEGNDVYPYKDALDLYLTNPSLASAYVPNSLTVQLGGLVNGVATAVPVPTSNGSIGPGDSIAGRYVSDRDIQVGGNHYVFAAVGEQPALVKASDWTPAVSGLPYQMPGVVLVTAKQNFKEQGRVEQQAYSSCATAGGAQYAVAAGAFVISCPDGNMSEITCPKDLWSGTMTHQIDGNPYLALGGDFPTDPGVKLSDAFCDDGKVPASQRFDPQPWADPSNPLSSEVALCCWYDWVRQAGARVDVDSVIAMTSNLLTPPAPPTTPWLSFDALGIKVSLGNVPTGAMHIFEIDPKTGKYTYKNKVSKPEPYYTARQNQLYAEDTGVPSKTPTWGTGVLPLVAIDPEDPASGSKVQTIVVKNKFDFYYRDYCRVLGSTNGGKHVGEPMVTKQISWARDYGSGGSGAGKGGSHGKGLPPIVSEAFDGFFTKPALPGFPPAYESGQDGTAGGEPRKTYLSDGLDCIITLRRQLDVSALGIAGIKTGYKGLML